MEASRETRRQLSRLRIDKGQRPAEVRSGSRWLFAVLAIVLVVAGVGFAFRHRLQTVLFDRLGNVPEVRLVTLTVRKEPGAPPVHTANGKIVSDHRVNVATKVSGQIVELSFEQGDRVTRGQVIARIETVNYRARRDNAAATLDRAKARLEYARVNFDRISALHERGSAPDIEFAGGKSEFEAARAQVAADKAELEEAQWRLDECAVKAPISGVVLARNVEVGDFVAAEGGFGGMANSQFAVIVDMTKLRVEVDVSELDIGKIRPDMPCRVTPDAYKDRGYDGHVMWLDPGANYSKGTVQVKVRIEGADDRLRVEGTARVDFLTERVTDTEGDEATLWLGKAAIAEGDGPNSGRVLVFNDGRLHDRRVALGRRSDRKVEIVSGVEPGARVVARITDDLQDGQRVRPSGPS